MKVDSKNMSDTNIIIDCKSVVRWMGAEYKYRKIWRVIEVDWPIAGCVIEEACNYIKERFPDAQMLLLKAIKGGLDSYHLKWKEGAGDQERFTAFYDATLSGVAEIVADGCLAPKDIYEELGKYIVRKLND